MNVDATAPLPPKASAVQRVLPESEQTVVETNVPQVTAMQSVEQNLDEADGQVDGANEVTGYTHGIRTAQDEGIPASQALEQLKEGNRRFLEGLLVPKEFCVNKRQALATYGQRPMATIIGCADSRCGPDVIFDAMPGDLFVLRNAGNTLTHAEGSIAGSAEYSVCNLHSHLIVVLGHTHCGAIAGATQCMLDRKTRKGGQSGPRTTLQSFLADLEPVAAQAEFELPAGATADEIAARAVHVNVFNSIEKLLAYSEPLRRKCRKGDLQIHGAIYDIVSGRVDFLGQHPRLPLLLGSRSGLMHHAPPPESSLVGVAGMSPQQSGSLAAVLSSGKAWVKSLWGTGVPRSRL